MNTRTASQSVGRAVERGTPSGQPLIRIVDLHKSFGSQVVLSGLNLELREAETTVVLGPSGTGKSVLLKCLMGLLKPDAGEIWFDGRRIDNLPERAMRDVRLQMGLLFQMSALFDSMTVEENIAFPLIEHRRISPDEVAARVRASLATVDMAGVEKKLPSQLSGGQRKRVALARAIVIEPRVVLYDEPTTGLDPVRSDGINELVLKLKRELRVTGVVVTHDLVSARKVADRLVMLLGGKMIAEGTYEQMIRSEDERVRHFFAGQYTHDLDDRDGADSTWEPDPLASGGDGMLS